MSRQEEKKEVTQKVENSQSRYINEQGEKVSEEAVEIVKYGLLGLLETLKSRGYG